MKGIPIRHASEFNPIVVGLVSALVIGALIVASFAVGTLGLFKHQYTITAVFNDSSGMKKGSPVKVAGVQVGKVTGVDADFTKGQVVVTMTVSHGVHLGPKTHASIGTATLLGGDQVKLTETTGKPYMEDRSGSGRRIPISRTSVPYTVIAALTDATTKFQQIDVNTLNTLLKESGQTVQEVTPQLPQLLENIGKVGQAVADRDQQLHDLVANGQQISGALASKDQQLVELIDRGNQLLSVLNGQRQQLADSIGTGSDIVKRLGGVLNDKRAQIDGILNDLHATLAVTERQLPNLNTGLAYAGQVFTRLLAVQGATGFNTQVTGIGGAGISSAQDFLCALLTVSKPGQCS